MDNPYPLSQAVLEQVAAELGARGVSVSSLARDMQQDRNTLRRYIKGEREMPLPMLTAILEHLGIDPVVFMARARDRVAEAAAPPASGTAEGS